MLPFWVNQSTAKILRRQGKLCTILTCICRLPENRFGQLAIAINRIINRWNGICPHLLKAGAFHGASICQMRAPCLQKGEDMSKTYWGRVLFVRPADTWYLVFFPYSPGPWKEEGGEGDYVWTSQDLYWVVLCPFGPTTTLWKIKAKVVL